MIRKKNMNKLIRRVVNFLHNEYEHNVVKLGVYEQHLLDDFIQ